MNVTRVGRTIDKLDIQPFKIHIPDIDVADLSERIKRTRWPDEYQNSNWDTDADKTHLKALLEYWASGYDWRAGSKAELSNAVRGKDRKQRDSFRPCSQPGAGSLADYHYSRLARLLC